MKLFAAGLLVAVSLASSAAGASLQQESPNSDRLGLRCRQILEMTSTQWVAHFHENFKSTKLNDANLSDSEKTLRAIAAYAKCYDARTTRLDEEARKRGGNKLLDASIQFRNLDQAIQAFSIKALSESEPPADEVKSAYAALYEKQFHYEFYRQLEQKTPAPAATPEELEQLGDAKNHFGELLDDLPPQKIKDLHAAFSRIFETPVSDTTKLAVYRYSIFCLEPASATPYSPPPF